MSKTVQLSNEQLNTLLNKYCLETYNFMPGNLRYIPDVNNPEEMSCYVVFSSAYGVVLTSSDIKTIVLNFFNIDAKSIKFATYNDNKKEKYKMIITEPITREKGK